MKHDKPTASDRQIAWPVYADQARKRAMAAAEDHADLLRDVLKMLRQIQTAAHTDPALVYELVITAQRDVALAISAFTDIRAWMVDAKRGREPLRNDESNGA